MTPSDVRTPVTRSPSRRISSDGDALDGSSRRRAARTRRTRRAPGAGRRSRPRRQKRPPTRSSVRMPGTSALDLGQVDHLDVHADALVHRQRRLELAQALRGARDEQVATLLEVVCASGDGLRTTARTRRRASIAARRARRRTDGGCRRARRCSSRCPSCSRSSSTHVVLAALGEEERRGAADDAAADDDGGGGRHVRAHFVEAKPCRPAP